MKADKVIKVVWINRTEVFILSPRMANFTFTQKPNNNVYLHIFLAQDTSSKALSQRADLSVPHSSNPPSSPGWTVPKVPCGSRSGFTRTVKMHSPILWLLSVGTIDLTQLFCPLPLAFAFSLLLICSPDQTSQKYALLEMFLIFSAGL